MADWDVLLLVDSGASYNFLSKRLASQLGWKIHSAPTTKIRLAKGDCVNSSGFAMGLILIGKWRAYVRSMVVDLVFDCVLGLPWLIQVNPQLDWSARNSAVKMSGRWVSLPTVTSPKAFASKIQPCKGPDSDEPELMIDWEAIEAHVKLLSMLHTAVECVKAAGIALM